jgi:hypothetical protein
MHCRHSGISSGPRRNKKFFLAHWTLENKGNMLFYKNQEPMIYDAVTHLRRSESTITPLRKLQNSDPTSPCFIFYFFYFQEKSSLPVMTSRLVDVQ